MVSESKYTIPWVRCAFGNISFLELPSSSSSWLGSILKTTSLLGFFFSPLSFHHYHHHHHHHHIFENMIVKLSSPQSGLCGEPVTAIEGERGGAADVGLQVEGDQVDKN